METKEIVKAVEDAVTEAKKSWEQSSESNKAEFKKQIDDMEGRIKELKEGHQKELDNFAVELKEKLSSQQKGQNTFYGLLGKALEEKKDTLSQFSKTKSKLDTSIEMDVKAVGDMSFANFGTGAYGVATTETRPGLFQTPFSPLWLRNILPNVSTNSAAIQYLRENGGEGAAAIWDETPSAGVVPSKPQIDHDFELVTESVDWIAGWTRIPRSMLDDITWLQGYLAQQLIYGRRGLFVAENGLIYDTLDANSVAYDGTNTTPIEAIYDAAFGQLMDSYYAPTHILMNHRDVVNQVMLNKATGSGEYDLPAGTVGIIGNHLYVAGVPVIGVPNIPAGEFFAFNNMATQFVSRMSPEVRFFEEDRDNVIKNLITVRAEERAAVLVFDENAIVKGTFGTDS